MYRRIFPRGAQCVSASSVTRNGVSRCSIRSWSSAQVLKSPIVELREYSLHPEHAVSYMSATNDAADLRKRLVPLRFFSLPETGGQLNVATHAYYYGGGHQERDEKRGIQAQDEDWKNYVGTIRPHVHTQSSLIFVEAPSIVDDFEAVSGLAKVPDSKAGKDCILEIRRYKLKLGYDTVPRFLELYGNGLPSKLEAEGNDPTTSLVTLLYSEVGRLNEVIEIWRHGNGTAAMEQSRVAARAANEWRSAIAGIADLAIEFTSTIHKPAAFSPIK
jgi:hypothetical protein